MWVTGGWLVQGISRLSLRFPSRFDGRFPSKETKALGHSKGFTWDLGNTVTLVCGHGWSSVWHTKFGSPLWLHVSFFPCLGPLLPDYF